MKRLFDFVAAVTGLVVLSPLFLLVAALIKADSYGPVFFRQERMGKNFCPFQIYKFRTMFANATQSGSLITAGEDIRITKIGRLLRHTKIDELPQLINVLKGEMSLVGPRPELRRYVDMFKTDYQEILRLRPGITDLASLKYHDEARKLGQAQDAEAEYINRILPDKIALAKQYVRQSSFLFDLGLIFKTLPKLFGRKLRLASPV